MFFGPDIDWLSDSFAENAQIYTGNGQGRVFPDGKGPIGMDEFLSNRIDKDSRRKKL